MLRRGFDAEYFVYVSDSKLEMLYEQIPWAQRESICIKLGIDFGIKKANFSTTNYKNTQTEKLKIVEEFIKRKIGTIYFPKTYFYGELNMVWGAYYDYENFVYFGGSQDGIQVGLGGTMTSCIGMHGKQNEEVTSYSMSPYLVSALAKKKETPDPHKQFTSQWRTNDLEESAISSVIIVNGSFSAIKERMKFLAKRVVYRNKEEKEYNSILIGSPIYVAYAD